MKKNGPRLISLIEQIEPATMNGVVVKDLFVRCYYSTDGEFITYNSLDLENVKKKYESAVVAKKEKIETSKLDEKNKKEKE